LLPQFGTLIIEDFGYDAFVSSLLLMPYGAVMCIGLPAFGYISSKYPNTRCINQFAAAFPAIIGSALVFYLAAGNQAGRLAGFYLTAFSNATLPLQFALMNSNTAGHTKRSITNAIMFLGYATGFIIGPQFFLSSEAPVYQTGFRTMLITFTLLTVAPIGMYAYLTWKNRKRDAAIVQGGGENVYTENEEFLDLTDQEQIHFRYAK
jgi:MFS family permease